jgi:hypothetical protein
MSSNVSMATPPSPTFPSTGPVDLIGTPIA